MLCKFLRFTPVTVWFCACTQQAENSLHLGLLRCCPSTAALQPGLATAASARLYVYCKLHICYIATQCHDFHAPLDCFSTDPAHRMSVIKRQFDEYIFPLSMTFHIHTYRLHSPLPWTSTSLFTAQEAHRIAPCAHRLS